MTKTTIAPATLDDLYRVEARAELIAGRIVHLGASGFRPARVAFQVVIELDAHAKACGQGVAFTGGLAYALNPPLRNGRQSFSPHASYYVGPPPLNRMSFVEGTPTLAVEVRNIDDYGPDAEIDRQAKRADYFEAGTLVVWDVDCMARAVVSYHADPSTPVAIFRPGDIATAEPAVPGWQVAVADLFEVRRYPNRK